LKGQAEPSGARTVGSTGKRNDINRRAHAKKSIPFHFYDERLKKATPSFIDSGSLRQPAGAPSLQRFLAACPGI